MEEFEAFFHIRYLPVLKFANKKEAARNCPYVLRNRWTGGENLELGEKYRQRLGDVADVSIRWIDPTFGYGLFTEKPLAKGEYIGEYTGVVRRLYRFHPDHNAYCFHYPTRFWSWKYMMVDALHEGNELRFANHSDDPTMEPLCMVDQNLLHLLFFAKRDLEEGEQLTFNYGEDYWRRRKKE